MGIRNGPCTWPLLFPCTGMQPPTSGCTHLDDLSTAARDNVIEAATEYLWNWSGRRYGLCTNTVRPCRYDCFRPTTYGPVYRGSVPYSAYRFGDPLFLPCTSNCSGPCACGDVEEVELPKPVDSVSQVLLDGAVLDPSAYRVDNNRWLVRTDGGSWPRCQDMESNPASDPNTFAVTYDQGVPVPSGGQIAAGTLSCEFAKKLCDDSTCQLPERITSITREGVSLTIQDSFDNLFSTGTTGLFLVDGWLASVMSFKRGSRISSPDVRAIRRTTSGG